jgi:asparagine synthase (glutamine-hydrolysing)
MCGICGFIIDHKDRGSADWGRTLSEMTALQAHRGPDQGGEYLAENGRYLVGLGHRRLSIIDLSEKGRQPMTNEDGTVMIVFNGEIYNYRDLDRQLMERNHVYRSSSDTETILHLYEEEQAACLYKLNGMFGFAIWDAKQQSLFLARDRLGIKPLYYASVGNGVAFASELKSLLRIPGISRRPLAEQIDQYMTFGYVPAPQTIFEGIYSLQPGYWLSWRAGLTETGRYWYPPVDGDQNTTGLKGLIDGLDGLLHMVVKSHLVADVPVGAFLSGGLDSSLVCAIAQTYLKEPLQTFTIGFGGGGDERAYAREVALRIGSDHNERQAEPDLTALLPRFVWHLEQPLFDNSILPTYLVSQLAREKCKVVLAGDGGDEPYFGYGWTRAAIGIPGLSLPVSPRGWKWNYRSGKWGMFQRGIFDLTQSARERYMRRLTTAENYRRWLYTPTFRGLIDVNPQDQLRRSIDSFIVNNWRERYPLADLLMYLPGDVLFKVDRMSMAHGLEVRPPLLDYRIVEWALRLPWKLRYNGGVGKVLLRAVAQRYLPDEVVRPRKQGFTIPIGRWLRGATGELAGRMFASEPFRRRGIIDPAKAAKLLAMHRSGRYELGHRIWSLVVLETWCRVWLDGDSAGLTLEKLYPQTTES